MARRGQARHAQARRGVGYTQRMSGLRPPKPEQLSRYLAKARYAYSPAVVAHMDRLWAEIKDDADAIGIDVESDDFRRAWIIAGGMLPYFAAAKQPDGDLDGVGRIERFWAVGFWPELEERNTARIKRKKRGESAENSAGI